LRKPDFSSNPGYYFEKLGWAINLSLYLDLFFRTAHYLALIIAGNDSHNTKTVEDKQSILPYSGRPDGCCCREGTGP
jgi:hypothetical protein